MDCIQSKPPMAKPSTQGQGHKFAANLPNKKASNTLINHWTSFAGKASAKAELAKPTKKNDQPDRKLGGKDQPVQVTKTQSVVAENTETSIDEELQAVTEKLDQPARAMHQSIEDLDRELEDNIKKLREVSERLNSQKSLFLKANSKSKKKKAEAPSIDFSDFIFASSTLKAGNRSIKHYIDNFVLTHDVMEKYDALLKTKKGHKSSTEDVLQFMIHTYKDLGLRQHENKFFEHAIEYNKLLQEFYENYIYLPLSNKVIDTFESKILDGVKLAVFVKQYMALIKSLKDHINYLDYENLDELFYPTPPNKSGTVSSRLVYKEGEEHAQAPSKRNDIIPIKIIIGNDKYGDKKMKKTKPSDVIQAGAELHPNLNKIDLSDVADEQKNDFIHKELNKLNSIERKAKQNSLMNGSLVNDSQFITYNQISDKYAKVVVEDSKDSQEAEFERLLAGPGSATQGNSNDKTSSFYSNSAVLDKTFQTPTKTQSQLKSESINVTSPNSGFDGTFVHHPNKLRSIERTQESSLQKTLQNEAALRQASYTTMENGVVYDENNIPINLEIRRAPEIERIDTRYEDTKHSLLNFDASRISMLKPKDQDMVAARAKFKEHMLASGPLRMVSGNVWADNMPVHPNSVQVKGQSVPAVQAIPASNQAPRNLSLMPQFNGRFITPMVGSPYAAPSMSMNQPSALRQRPKSQLAGKTDAVYRELLRQQI